MLYAGDHYPAAAQGYHWLDGSGAAINAGPQPKNGAKAAIYWAYVSRQGLTVAQDKREPFKQIYAYFY